MKNPGANGMIIIIRMCEINVTITFSMNPTIRFEFRNKSSMSQFFVFKIVLNKIELKSHTISNAYGELDKNLKNANIKSHRIKILLPNIFVEYFNWLGFNASIFGLICRFTALALLIHRRSSTIDVFLRNYRINFDEKTPKSFNPYPLYLNMKSSRRPGNILSNYWKKSSNIIISFTRLFWVFIG